MEASLPLVPMLRKALTIRAHSMFHSTGNPTVLPKAAVGPPKGFDVHRTPRPSPITEGEEVLSETLMRTWGRFARTGDPSGDGLHWPGTPPDGDVFLTLDLEPAVGTGLKRDECNFWDTLER
jgi:hypothetical protein